MLGLSLMLFVIVSGMGLSLIPIVASGLQDSFGFSASQIGFLNSAYMLTFSLGAIPMGLAGARWGGKALLAGTGLLVAGSALFAFTASYPWFVVARLLQGIGAGAPIPVANSLIAQTVDRRYQGWAFGAFGSGQGLGVVAALLILPSVETAGGYRGVLLVVAAVAVVFVAISLAHKVMRARPRHAEVDVSFAGLMRTVGSVAMNRRLMLLIVVNIGAMAIFVGVLTWTPSFLHDQWDRSLAMAAYLTAGLGVAQILGNMAGAAAMSRWGKTFVLVTGMAIMFVATALVPVAPGVVAVFACVTVAGFLTMALFPAILGSIPEIVPRLEQVGAASGYMTTCNLVATLFAPWLFGVLLDSYGTGPGERGYLLGYQLLALFALLGTVAAVLYLLARRRAQRIRRATLEA